MATPLSQASTASFPPKANAAWIYDPPADNGSRGKVKPGHFTDVLTHYNDDASSGARISEFYIYAGDMEMYCPEHRAKQCQPDDFHVYYSNAAQHGNAIGGRDDHHGNTSVQAYARWLSAHPLPDGEPALIVPIIDGVVSGHGALRGFNDLSRKQAEAFADKVTEQVCADDSVDGIQFDLEPFNVVRQAGQYYFYKRIAQNFASRSKRCVDSSHPQGRFFSIFTVANRIRPGTPSADNVQKIMQVANNGYLIDALYDLKGTLPGHQTSAKDYQKLVQRETSNMRNWAAQIGIKFQFGVPAAASAHEFGECRGAPCQASQKTVHGNAVSIQLAYVKSAVAAIRSSGAMQDPHYLGVALWAWSPGLHYKGMQFSPKVPGAAVTHFLSEALVNKG